MLPSMVRLCMYPTQAVTGFGTFLAGTVQLLFCQPFFFLIPGILDGIFMLVVAFHGIFLRYPNRCNCILQCVGSLLAACLLLMSIFELFCVRRDDLVIPESTVCYGLEYRIGWLMDGCRGSLGSLQRAVERGARVRGGAVRKMNAALLLILSAVQLLVSTSLAWYSANETRIDVRAHHWQLPLGVAVLAFGAVHFVYCCTYFYVAFGIWVGIYILLQASVSWRTECRSTITRALNVIGAALGMALTAGNGFGLFCWMNSQKDSHFAFRHHCQWRQSAYGYCMRKLAFMQPYIDWPKGYFESEVSNLQLAAYISLFIAGIIQFALSLRSAFRRTF